MAIAERMPEQLRRRILMFYFAAGINIVMAMWVISAVGSTEVSGVTLAMICFVFAAFAVVNLYFAKWLKKRWEQGAQARAAERQPGD